MGQAGTADPDLCACCWGFWGASRLGSPRRLGPSEQPRGARCAQGHHCKALAWSFRVSSCPQLLLLSGVSGRGLVGAGAALPLPPAPGTGASVPWNGQTPAHCPPGKSAVCWGPGARSATKVCVQQAACTTRFLEHRRVQPWQPPGTQPGALQPGLLAWPCRCASVPHSCCFLLFPAGRGGWRCSPGAQAGRTRGPMTRGRPSSSPCC